MKKFLDKDYITNMISYTGARHSSNYVYILIKNFNFKITNYSYLNDGNIKNIEKMIKNDKKSNSK
jgi:hypothetical protein